jgi:hypothetical protein
VVVTASRAENQGSLTPWRGASNRAVAVDGPLVVDDAEIHVPAALDGIGVVWTLEHYAPPIGTVTSL